MKSSISQKSEAKNDCFAALGYVVKFRVDATTRENFTTKISE